MSFRILILLLLLFAIDYYAFQAVRLAGPAWPKSLRTSFYIAYGLTSLLGYLYILGSITNAFDSQSSQWAQYARALVFIVFISKFIIGIFVGIDDIRRLLLWGYNQFSEPSGFSLSRSRFLSQLGIFAGAIPLVSLTYGMWRNPYRYQIHKHKVPINDLPSSLQGLRIVQISDIHSGTFMNKEPLETAVEMINNLNADVVLFTGDLVNNAATEMEPFIEVFDKIKSRYGVYSVLGNHDYGDYIQWNSLQEKQENFEQLIRTHKILGWDLLRNENRVLQINGENIAVIGVENSSASPRFHNYGDLKKAILGTDGIALKILLSHDPSHWDAEVTREYKDVALTFSGHTHGFQFGIEIPGLVKWSPSKYVYKQWAGLYTNGSQHLYVNRGFGMLGYPGRVGILPEITCIDLLEKASDTI